MTSQSQSVNPQNLLKKLTAVSLIATTSLAAIQPARAWSWKDIFTVGGAIGGGALCYNNVKGGAKIPATFLCAIGGGILAGELGQLLDEADQRAMSDAQLKVYENDLYEYEPWDGETYGSRTRSRGRFRFVRPVYHTNYDYKCREWNSIVEVPSRDRFGRSVYRTEEKRGYVCQYADGSWKEVKKTYITETDRWGNTRTNTETEVRTGDGDRQTPRNSGYYWIVGAKSFDWLITNLSRTTSRGEKMVIVRKFYRFLRQHDKFLSADQLAETLSHFQMESVKLDVVSELSERTDVRVGGIQPVLYHFGDRDSKAQVRSLLK